MKEMVIRSWQDMSIRPTPSRNNSIIDGEFTNESFSVEDRAVKDLTKRIKEIDENTRRKILTT